jgi:hypothetical protein
MRYPVYLVGLGLGLMFIGAGGQALVWLLRWAF